MFFSNRRPGLFGEIWLTAEELSRKKPGLIHAKVVLHGEQGPWSNRVGFDEIGAAVSGLVFHRRDASSAKSPPIIPIATNVVAGSAPSVSSRPCAGVPSREAAIALSYP